MTDIQTLKTPEVAAGADAEQCAHLLREVAEVELVFQCRGWA